MNIAQTMKNLNDSSMITQWRARRADGQIVYIGIALPPASPLHFLVLSVNYRLVLRPHSVPAKAKDSRHPQIRGQRCDDGSPIAVPYQYDVGQIMRFDKFDDILNVRVERDVGAVEVRFLAKTRQRHRQRPMPLCL